MNINGEKNPIKPDIQMLFRVSLVHGAEIMAEILPKLKILNCETIGNRR